MDRIEVGDHPHRRLRSWESGERGHWRHVLLELGILEEGRWYASRARRHKVDTWAAHTERQAAEAVEAWMRRLGTGWRESTGQDA